MNHMSSADYPITAGVRFLRAKKIDFEPRLYNYQEHGGTERASRQLGFPEHAVVKTLMMETDDGKPLVVLMHGDREVSTQRLARALGAKNVGPSDQKRAEKLSGYVVGGISPFGMRQALPVYVEKSILDLPRILINGGKRGFLVEIDPSCLRACLPVTEVEVAQPGRRTTAAIHGRPQTL